MIHIAARYRGDPTLDRKCMTEDCKNTAAWHVDFLDEKPPRITELCNACMDAQCMGQTIKIIK